MRKVGRLLIVVTATTSTRWHGEMAHLSVQQRSCHRLSHVVLFGHALLHNGGNSTITVTEADIWIDRGSRLIGNRW